MPSAFNYGSAAKLANGLLEYFGASATITRRIEGAYDPATGAATVSSRRFSATACVLDFKDRRDADPVIRGERRLLVSPLSSFEPQVGDHVKVGALEFQISEVLKVAPAGVSVLYDCTVTT